MIAEGTYEAQLVKNDGKWLDFGYAKTGSAQVLLCFQIKDGPKAAEYFSISPKAVEYTKQKLEACGFTGNDFRAMKNQTPHGKVEIVVVQEDYDDNKGRRQRKPKILFVNPIGGGGHVGIKDEKRIPDDDLDSLSELLKNPTEDDKLGF